MGGGELLRTLVSATLIVPATLLPIINPLGIAPIFMSVTGGDESLTREMARRVAVNCFFLLAGALLVGGLVLDFFGLSVPIVKVAGGLVVAAAGWRLLNDSDQDDLQRSVANASSRPSEMEIARRSFLPMSFPLTVGPGSIAAAITLGAKRPEHAVEWVPKVIGAFAGLMLTVAAIFLTYRYSGRLLSKLGEVGTLVLMRLAAFILLCIGVQILWGGWTELAKMS